MEGFARHHCSEPNETRHFPIAGYDSGIAGIGQFMVELYKATQNQSYEEGAISAANWIISHANTSDNGLKWPKTLASPDSDAYFTGYSYGAAIGCSTVNYSDKIKGYCAISFPWDFMGREFKNFSQSEKPKLFIQGNRDTIANYRNFENHYNFYLEPKEYRIIDGADHFYYGYEPNHHLVLHH